jgi:hypothetical protein
VATDRLPAVHLGRHSGFFQDQRFGDVRKLRVYREHDPERPQRPCVRAAINQIKGLLVSGPDKIRAKYRVPATSALITALQRTSPSGHTADPEYVTLNTLAARCQALGTEIEAC